MIDAVRIYLPGHKPIYYAVGHIFPDTVDERIIEFQRLENGILIVTKSLKTRFCGVPYITYEIRHN